MRMEMALKMEMMSMIINHGSANIHACTCREGDADITSVVGEDTTILAWVPRNARG